MVTNLAGWIAGYVNGIGTAASFNSVDDIVVDTIGNVFVCDGMNYAIRKVSPAGKFSAENPPWLFQSNNHFTLGQELYLLMPELAYLAMWMESEL